MTSKTKAILLNDTHDGYHWGCYGTSQAIRNQIEANDIDLTDVLTVFFSAHALNVPKRFLKPELDIFIDSNRQEFKRIKKADIVIINGEGTIHGFFNAPKALLAMMYVCKHVFNQKVYVINHSCYLESNDKYVLYYYKKGYQSCDFIAVREQRSFDIVKNTLSCDPVLAFDSMPILIRQMKDSLPAYKGKQYICISGGCSYKNKINKHFARYLKSVFPDFKYVFLTGSMKGVCDDFDIDIYCDIKNHLPEMELVNAQSFEEFLSTIKHADYLISGRYHYTIAAMALSVPFIAFESNTPKITAISEMFSLEKPISFNSVRIAKLKLLFRMKSLKNTRAKNILDKMCDLALNNYLCIQKLI